MTKERNFDMNYPMYGNMPGMGMPMPMPQGMPHPGMNMPGMMMDKQMHTQGDHMSSIKSQLSNLEKRVAHLESVCGSQTTSNKYTDSNFYMV